MRPRSLQEGAFTRPERSARRRKMRRALVSDDLASFAQINSPGRLDAATIRHRSISDGCDMESAYVPVLAAFGGSAIGGLTSLAATWLTQRRKDSARRLTQEKTRRQKLYKKFIDEASKLYADALVHDKSEVSSLVDMYALI